MIWSTFLRTSVLSTKTSNCSPAWSWRVESENAFEYSLWRIVKRNLSPLSCNRLDEKIMSDWVHWAQFRSSALNLINRLFREGSSYLYKIIELRQVENRATARRRRKELLTRQNGWWPSICFIHYFLLTCFCLTEGMVSKTSEALGPHAG